jgi:hypothetical protein
LWTFFLAFSVSTDANEPPNHSPVTTASPNALQTSAFCHVVPLIWFGQWEYLGKLHHAEIRGRKKIPGWLNEEIGSLNTETSRPNSFHEENVFRARCGKCRYHGRLFQKVFSNKVTIQTHACLQAVYCSKHVLGVYRCTLRSSPRFSPLPNLSSYSRSARFLLRWINSQACSLVCSHPR